MVQQEDGNPHISGSSAAVVTPSAVPAVSDVLLSQGPATGGTSVTVTGMGFTGATDVTFGATRAATFTVNSSTRITATTPALPVGQAAVVVTTSQGPSNSNVVFTALPVPVLSSAMPEQIPEVGNTTVVLHGTGFTGATQVVFGGRQAVSFTVNSDNRITATVPPGTGGVFVTITTPGGTSSTVPITYLPTPRITGLAPAEGPEAGGGPVTINGSGLTYTSSVKFGADLAPFMVLSDTQLAATPPPGTGTVQITVTSPEGTSGQLPYRYVPAPSI
ncbi:IPT/TIG domain-containing protein [Allosalinactinospora lopnorensis]|uniref:IPT/TIG domain-containing protein n=1 Tax=Allosalinactinospora lopnorensis TaxID=1352348 RepID=UPI000623D494|nr:IPT/TIG domain-containing protein [Allosalinactinospora lopnorensis]